MTISKLIPLVLLAASLMLLGCSTPPVHSDPQGHFTVEIDGDWYGDTDALVSALSEEGDHFVISVAAVDEKTEAVFFVKTWGGPLCKRCKYFTGGPGDAQRLLDWAKDWLWAAQNETRDVVSHGDIVSVEGERGLFVEVETTHNTTKSIRRFYASQSGIMLEAICAVKKSRWSFMRPRCSDILDTLVVNR